ncbi:galactose/methyl galactoside ABC transporter permease MglC [Clostridium thermarum]|uniref:galactose/methyl galactoside ABC transporter permease MglC n=1 Tax=Clostridium thermarum TaxID=1716543 RepID=UPI0013D57E10|nr:galactose/methyl galactoside ABC transporter permease MglC [Clostridium thermarum]
MSKLNTTKKASNGKGLKKLASDNAIYLVFAVLVIAISFWDPRFLSLTTVSNLLLQNSTKVIIALGMAFILITGGVDLGAGRLVGFAAVISASMLQNPDYARRFFPGMPQLSVIIPVLIAIVAGIAVGIINGVVISKFNVPAFIATLGTMVAVYGINSIYFDLPPNDSQPIGGLRADFTKLGSGYLFNFIPIVVLIAVLVIAFVWVIFNKTRLGKNMYAIGGNADAAKVSGINVGKNIIILYAIASALFALGGVLEAARTGGATNNYGNGYELDAIASCVVGGVSNLGGRGTVAGVIIGVLIFGVINYGLTFIGVNPYWQQIIKGFIIVAAVGFDIRKYVAKK